MQLAEVVRLSILAASALAELDGGGEDAGDVLGRRVLLHLPVEAEGRVLHHAVLEELGAVAPPKADDDRDDDDEGVGGWVIILGGDISGLGIFSYLTKEMPQYQFECLDPLIEDNWRQTILPVKPDWDIIEVVNIFLV